MTGDIVTKRVRIFDGHDDGKEATINLVHAENAEDKATDDPNYFFSLNEATVDQLYKDMQANDVQLLSIFTMELTSDPETPNTIRQALSGKGRKLWKKSAISEVNTFLKRESRKFIKKEIVKSIGRRPIGVKWVFKIKNDVNYSLRYKYLGVTKGYM